ncbi:MAG: hypothetical protein M3548_14160 [Actinomycetota bacterium]|nr:hypothetical protein [Actinomycetota bacterium]
MRTVCDRVLRLAVLVTVFPALLVLTAPTASAQAAIEGGMPVSLAGPVGIAAVIAGVGGVVIGLIRRRKVTVSQANQRIVIEEPVPLPAPRHPVTSGVTAD